MVIYLKFKCNCGASTEFSKGGYAMAKICGYKCHCGRDIVIGENIDTMIKICLNHLTNEKHKEFIVSLKNYYENREMLTEKQYKALLKWRTIIADRLFRMD